MPNSLLIKPVGLYSFPNHIGAVPEGALLEASNVMINRDNIVESRRGFKLYGNAMTTSAHQLIAYKNRLIRHSGSGSGSILEYDSDGAGTFVPFNLVINGNTHGADGPPTAIVNNLSSTAELEEGMFVSGSGIQANTTILAINSNTQITLSLTPTTSLTATPITFSWDISELVQGTKIKYVESNGNLYFTSSEGIRKVCLPDTSWSSSPIISMAGGIQALDTKLSLNGSSGFLTPESVVAYRVVWGITDANNNEILGAPSQREIITNTSSSTSANVNYVITIPPGVSTAYFYQIYRTPVVSNVSTFTITGDTTNTSATVVNVSDTAELTVGMPITGTGIPANTTISNIISTTSFIMSANATATNTGILITISQVLQQDPGDEEQLVFEGNPTNTDLSNGYVSGTDITPETFRAGGANLYTNANSGEGILQANNSPPLALDITSFKGYTFYANTKTQQQLNVALLSVSNLVSNTSTLTITDGVTTNTYTFRDTADGGEDTATKHVLISGLSTPAQQVDQSARSLVHVINSQASEIVFAYYLSGPTDVPGKILLQSREIDQSPFYLTVNDPTTTGQEFNPVIPINGTVPPTNTVISTNSVNPNRIFYSKYEQPEAVPIVNYIDVGPQDQPIIRIVALRDSLFILKQDGVYRLSGLVSPFTVYPFDYSTIIVAPESPAVINNLIYMYSSQGIAQISDTGIQVISRPIEDTIMKLIIPAYTNFKTATFGVTYLSDWSYYLFTVSSTTDTYATQCLRYNTFTNNWTLLDLSKRCATVNPYNDLLYLGATDVNYIEQERKNFDRTDYADREIALTLGSSAITNTTYKLPSVVNITPGDILFQEQYLTIKQFNQLLSKLDKDPLLSPHNYISSNTALVGDNLSNDLDTLITHISTDSGRVGTVGATPSSSYTALIGTGSSSFSALQTAFNNLISLLNNDLGVGYKNYINSSGVTDYEFNILTVTTSNNTVTGAYQYPLIQGPFTIYNHIDTAIQFVPQYFQDVSMTKHVSEGTLIFEDSSFSVATLSYASDLSGNFEDQNVSGNGNGIFGNLSYGNALFGGNGSGIPFRTLLPKNKQRCRYINVQFKHSIGRESFSLYGLSLVYNMVSPRGWR